MKIILQSEFNVERPNYNVWGAPTNSRHTNPLLLVQLNSLSKVLKILLPAVVISVFSLATQRWNSGTYNSRISRLATAGKHINYHLLDANNIYSAYFGCLALQLRNISTSDEQSFSQSVPPGPASEPGREVMCLGISHSGSTYHLNKRIPSIFWQMATLWNSCREAKGPTFKAHVQHKKLTATYSYGSAVLK